MNLLMSDTLWVRQATSVDRLSSMTDDRVWGDTESAEATSFDQTGVYVSVSMTVGMFSARG